MPHKVRVAVAGKTIDGREITEQQIDEMAASYDPDVYGARIWLDHFRSIVPDGTFKAHGDVLSLSTENFKGNKALYAVIEPSADLIALNRNGQKVFTSIEMIPNFQGTGKAYLYGLAVTDSPASTGTQMLKFSVEKGLVANSNQFSAEIETEFAEIKDEPAAEQADDADDETITLTVKSKDANKGLFARLFGREKTDDIPPVEQETDDMKALETFKAESEKKQQEFINQISELNKVAEKFADENKELKADLKALKEEFTVLKSELESTPATPDRPLAGAGNEQFSTDC